MLLSALIFSWNKKKIKECSNFDFERIFGTSFHMYIFFLFNVTALHPELHQNLNLKLAKLAPNLQFLKGVYILGVYILRCEVP